jgi:hypothetical protein
VWDFFLLSGHFWKENKPGRFLNQTIWESGGLKVGFGVRIKKKKKWDEWDAGKIFSSLAFPIGEKEKNPEFPEIFLPDF